MIEYDQPGHANSWRKADESIVANCPNNGYSSINPINELTYDYIRAYIKDIFDAVSVFGAHPILHLGGDEVDYGCWNNDPAIATYMEENGLTTSTLWQQMNLRVIDIINDMDPRTMR